MNRSKPHSASSTDVGLPLGDDSVNQAINFIRREGVTRTVTKPPKGFMGYMSNVRILIQEQGLDKLFYCPLNCRVFQVTLLC